MRQKIIYWTPRILALLFVIFLSVFSLDVFNEYSGWAAVPALFMHLLIPIALLVALAVAWRYDIVGVAAFLAFTAYYFYTAGFDRHWTVYALIVVPALLISFMFWLSWRQMNRIR